MIRNIEILAPCGSASSFEAAINARADAVYLAGNRFGARAYAENFSDEELCRAIEKAHLKGVKVYLTVNTLFKNAEIRALPEYLRGFYEEGLDAVIVQDLGAFSVVRKAYTDLPIHASTQMNICSSEGAEFLKRLGAERVIPARELTLDEIRNIKKKVDTEIEVFVHGAMCYCYSGRCLFSSMAGDRSGNRGRCAQPCRRKYNDSYLMSMKDMCALPLVPELMEAGVDSLKIEGRMKGDYYTASVVDAYRQMADDHISGCFSMKKCEKYIEKLSETFSRGGFCNGYFDKSELPYMIDSTAPGHKGIKVGEVISAGHGKVTIKAFKEIGIRDVLTIELGKDENVEITSNTELITGKTAVFNVSGSRGIRSGAIVRRKINKSILDNIKTDLIENEKLMPVDVSVKLKQGEPLSLTVISGEYSKTVFGSVVMRAEKRAITDENIIDKMRGFGELGYNINTLTIDNDNESFISFSELKSLRREAVFGLNEMILSIYRRKAVDDYEYKMSCRADDDHEYEKNSGASDGRYNVITNDSSQHKKRIYISLVNEKAAEELKKYFEKIPPEIPEGVSYAFGFTVDMFTINKLCELKEFFSKIGSLAVELPFIHREEDEGYFTELYEKILDDGFDLIYVRNIDDFSALMMNKKLHDKTVNMDIMLAHSLYGYNNAAVDHIYFLCKDYFRSVIFEYPHELTIAEIGELKYPLNAGQMLNVYGKEELMLTAQEPDRKSKGFLKDERSGAYRYFKSRDLCYNTLIDQKPIVYDYNAALDNDLLDNALWKITLHDETSEKIAGIIQYYSHLLERQGKTADSDQMDQKSERINEDKAFKLNIGKTSEGHFYKPIL